MVLYGYGWSIYEMDIDFNHFVQGGLDRDKHTAEFHRQRIDAVAADYRVYRDVLDRYIKSRNTIVYSDLLQFVERLERSERKHHEGKLRKMGEL